jgi:hypothetical protein
MVLVKGCWVSSGDLIHTLRCCGELRRNIYDTSSAIRGSLSGFLRQSCGCFPQIRIIVGFGTDGKSRRVCGCCRLDLHFRLRHNDRLSHGSTHLATSHPAAFQARNFTYEKCLGRYYGWSNGMMGMKDLRLGTVLPKQGALFTSIYRMVTTLVPALSQRIHALAHGTPCRSRPPRPAAVLPSPFMRSSFRLPALYWLPPCAFCAKMASLA